MIASFNAIINLHMQHLLNFFYGVNLKIVSSVGFGGWHMGNQSQDEVFLAAQEAVGAHRDSQGKI